MPLQRSLRRVAFALLLAAGCFGAAPVPPSFILILADDQSWVGTSQRMIPEDPATASDYHRTQIGRAHV